MTEKSTALAEQQPQRPRPPAIQSGTAVSAFVPTDIEQAFRLANALAMSGMTPKAYGDDVNKCFVGIMAGAELGLAPFQALQSIAVIGNNPAIWGDGALALVQASGLLEDIEEADDGNTATCKLVRKGRATPIIRSFSMDDAKKAGLAGKSGPWTQYPQRMRQMRARSWAMRDGFADVLKGLHIAEEVRDRPDLMDDAPKPQRLSSAMLAQQAGATVEQVQDAEVTELSFDRTGETLPDASDEMREAEGVTEMSEAAEETLADIDGPLDDAEDNTPPPYEVKAGEIMAKVARQATVIDLKALRQVEDANIAAMPDDVAARVKATFKAKMDELKPGGAA